MGSKWGRHFVWSCIAGQDVLRTVSSTNSLTMSASAGVNDYVVNVLRRLRDLSPSEFIKMQEEAHERDRNAAARSAPNTNHG